MAKTATLNLRVDPELKHDAEQVLSHLGLPMSVAIDLFLNQIVLNNGLPFAVAVPESIDATKMTDVELHAKLKKGYDDYLQGRVHDIDEVF